MFVLTATALFASPRLQAAEDPKPEMWDEPSHHLVFEHDDTRIVDVRIAPGLVSEFHNHRYATVYIVVQDAMLLNQRYGQEWSEPAERPYRLPGTAVDRAGYAFESQYHRVKNDDNRAFHLLAVVNTKPARNSRGVGVSNRSGDPVENRWFTERRIELNPGQRSDVLRFEHDVVLVQYGSGSSHVTEKGVAHSFKSVPGAFSWHAAGAEFRIANGGEQPQEFILIEIKNQKTGRQPTPARAAGPARAPSRGRLPAACDR